jgi:hypothetical protein
MAEFKTTKAPNLVISEFDYKIQNEEQFRNQLRLYFNQVDSGFEQILIGQGGANIDFPHIAAYYDADQYATADDTPTKVLWNNAPDVAGFTLNVDNTATTNYDGTYKIEYRLQAINTDNVAHNIVVWMQVEGSDLANSATEFTLAARKSATEFTYSALTGFVSWEATAGESVALYWATEKAYNTTGPVDGTYLYESPTQTSPYARPEIPSAYGVIQYIGRE